MEQLLMRALLADATINGLYSPIVLIFTPSQREDGYKLSIIHGQAFLRDYAWMNGRSTTGDGITLADVRAILGFPTPEQARALAERARVTRLGVMEELRADWDARGPEGFCVRNRLYRRINGVVAELPPLRRTRLGAWAENPATRYRLLNNELGALETQGMRAIFEQRPDAAAA